MANKTLWVKTAMPIAPDGGSEIAFYERDDAHPGGQAWVASDKPVEVGDTDTVRDAIRAGRLQETKAPGVKDTTP